MDKGHTGRFLAYIFGGGGLICGAATVGVGGTGADDTRRHQEQPGPGRRRRTARQRLPSRNQ